MPNPGTDMGLTARLEALLPMRLRRALRQAAANRARPEAEFQALDRRGTFARIYRDDIWGRNPDGDLGPYSGPGSHYPRLVDPYLRAVTRVLEDFDSPPRIVDLGCGDFNIGAQLAPLASAYVACDLVEEVIAANQARYDLPNVEFKVLDIVSDPLPHGDVAILRQVLQHLSNAEIKAVCDKLPGRFGHLILTEHLALPDRFIANIDKPAGRDARLAFGSGIDLTQPPFDLACKSRRGLCETPDYGGVIQTVAFTF